MNFFLYELCKPGRKLKKKKQKNSNSTLEVISLFKSFVQQKITKNHLRA